MTMPQRFFLVFTLTMLLLGLAAHSMPFVSVCACADISEAQAGTSGLDACLVCQLQTGVQVSSVSTLSSGDELPSMDNAPFPVPQEHVARIPHPPILF
jgi:hypothetical protein